MGWRVAESLQTLLKQLNELAPGRSKVSDGSIGDTAHSNRASDHNPWYGPGIVTARDFTHDPGKLDGHSLASRLATSGDPRLKYVIWNRRIWSPGAGWQSYSGANPHTSHVHVSVVASPICDDPRPWAPFIKQEEGRFLADLTDAEQKEILTAVRNMYAAWDRDHQAMLKGIDNTVGKLDKMLEHWPALIMRQESLHQGLAQVRADDVIGGPAGETNGLQATLEELRNAVTDLRELVESRTSDQIGDPTH